MVIKVLHRRDNETTYEVGRTSYTIVWNKDIPDFTRLELSNRIYDHIDVLFCKDFFKLFLTLRTLAEDQVRLLEENQGFDEGNILEAKFVRENRTQIAANAVKFKELLNKFLLDRELEEVNDVVVDDQIAQVYLDTYFTDNLWFEIFCEYLIIKCIQRKRKSFRRNEDYLTILSQDIKGKTHTHQIDVILLLKQELVLLSAKTGTEGRNVALAFAKQKQDIQADLGIIFLFNKYADGHYYGKHEQIFIIDNVKDKTFAQLENELCACLGTSI